MTARASKSVFLYERVRRELQTGRFVPGERVDPHLLADEYSTSPTPVLYALHRLVGEGMLHHDVSEGGFHVPRATERLLRDLYDWMQRLLLMACDIGGTREKRDRDTPHIPNLEDDVVRQTRALFEDIARAANQQCLYFAVRRTNDRLEPTRRAAQILFDDAPQEIAHLQRLWLRRDISHLKTGLVTYHDRRKRLVPYIVGLLDGSVIGRPKAD